MMMLAMETEAASEKDQAGSLLIQPSLERYEAEA